LGKLAISYWQVGFLFNVIKRIYDGILAFYFTNMQKENIFVLW